MAQDIGQNSKKIDLTTKQERDILYMRKWMELWCKVDEYEILNMMRFWNGGTAQQIGRIYQDGIRIKMKCSCSQIHSSKEKRLSQLSSKSSSKFSHRHQSKSKIFSKSSSLSDQDDDNYQQQQIYQQYQQMKRQKKSPSRNKNKQFYAQMNKNYKNSIQRQPSKPLLPKRKNDYLLLKMLDNNNSPRKSPTPASTQQGNTATLKNSKTSRLKTDIADTEAPMLYSAEIMQNNQQHRQKVSQYHFDHKNIHKNENDHGQGLFSINRHHQARPQYQQGLSQSLQGTIPANIHSDSNPPLLQAQHLNHPSDAFIQYIKVLIFSERFFQQKRAQLRFHQIQVRSTLVNILSKKKPATSLKKIMAYIESTLVPAKLTPKTFGMLLKDMGNVKIFNQVFYNLFAIHESTSHSNASTSKSKSPLTLTPKQIINNITFMLFKFISTKANLIKLSQFLMGQTHHVMETLCCSTGSAKESFEKAEFSKMLQVNSNINLKQNEKNILMNHFGNGQIITIKSMDKTFVRQVQSGQK